MTKQHGGAIVDLGNVIVAHWLGNITPETFLTIDYNSIPEAPGVFDSLRRINERFGGNVTVVYNSTGIATEKILAWLANHNFVERTGIGMERVCRTTRGRDKTPYLDQSSNTHYGTTVVVDDRLEVLSHFVGEIPNLFLFRPQAEEIKQFRNTGALPHVRIVRTWKEIEEILNL